MKNSEIIGIGKHVMRNESHSINVASKSLDNSFARVIRILSKSKGNIDLTGIGKSGDIAKKIALLVSDTELREKLRMAGYIRQKQFSWENSANAVCNLLYAIK